MKISEQHKIWPRLTRFYGISPVELLNTPNALIRLYVQMMAELEAEEQLARLQASDFPQMQPEHRKRVWRALERQIDVETPTDRVDATSEADQAKLAGIGIRVVVGDA